MQGLTTEEVYAKSTGIDLLSTAEMLRVINQADQEVAEAVEQEIGQIALAVDGTANRLGSGGRLFLLGAGTSGRLAVLDASECPPTFNTPADLVQGVIAGGNRALRHPIERAEDDPDQGRKDLDERGFQAADALVGIAASGRTPYVLGALAYARRLGALTIGVSCTADSEVAQTAEISITPTPGPEVITGSTRMRAGTATKLVLNMLTTGVMIKLGFVYGNLMVNVQPTNSKLENRACRIIAMITGVSYEDASQLLAQGGSVRIAVMMQKRKLSREEAEKKLAAAKGRLRVALGE